MGALMSIQSYRELSLTYFDRFRAAVENAEAFFVDEEHIPGALLTELDSAAQILRNEATVFPGRTAACLEMADWLTATGERLKRA